MPPRSLSGVGCPVSEVSGAPWDAAQTVVDMLYMVVRGRSFDDKVQRLCARRSTNDPPSPARTASGFLFHYPKPQAAGRGCGAPSPTLLHSSPDADPQMSLRSFAP
mmetsp:Transcript_18383/g.40202  ORF Transcript_18383/g.40202 Transcript_18383/m.40202 type:complete len:106 (-) Transcript_18383:1179-1496(-)